MNNIFLPMFFVGLAGVNRRLYDAGAQFAMAQPYQGLQRHMTVAAIALGIAQIPFLIALATARRAPPIEAGQTRLAAVPRADTDVAPWLVAAWQTMFFGSLLSGYVLLRAGNVDWPMHVSGWGARARWRCAAGCGCGRGATDTGGPSRLGGVWVRYWSCGCQHCTTPRSRPGTPRCRTSSLRRGSRSPVCCSPSSPSCVARRRGMRFVTLPCCPRERAGSGSSGDRCH